MIALSGAKIVCGGIAAVAVILLHLLRSQRPRMSVSAGMFWKQLTFRDSAQGRIPKPSRSVLLFLHLLIVLITAMMLPTESPDPASGSGARFSVMILDNTASMTGGKGSSDRMAEMRQKAAQLIASLGTRDRMSIVAAGRTPRILCPPTDDRKRLHGCLENLLPTHESGSIQAAVRLARQLAQRQGAAGETHLSAITDNADETRDASDLNGSVNWLSVGEPTPNTGIIQFQVRRIPHSTTAWEAFFEVFNSGQDSIECELQLVAADESLLDLVPMRIGPRGTFSGTMRFESESVRWLCARLTDRTESPKVLHGEEMKRDGLQADDMVYVMLPESRRIPVVLVTSGSVFLEKVFETIPGVDLSVTQEMPTRTPSDGLLVLHQTNTEHLPDGDLLIIDPVTDSPLWSCHGVQENPEIMSTDRASELLNHVWLDRISWGSSVRLVPKTPFHSLVTCTDNNPLLLMFNDGRRRVFVLGTSLGASDLVLRTDFPILIRNLVALLKKNADNILQNIRPGETVRLRNAPQHLPGSEIPRGYLSLTPELQRTVQISESADSVVGPIPLAGIWVSGHHIPDTAAVPRSELPTEPLVACSLLDRKESDIGAILGSIDPSGAESLSESLSVPDSVQKLMMLTVLFCLALEWPLFHRRLLN